MVIVVYNSHMDFANQQGQNLGAKPLSVQVATEADEADILRLIGTAQYVHMSADWSISADWWQQHGVAIASRGDALKAAIAASCEPRPIAWLRAIAIDMGEPGYALRKVLPTLADAMRQQSASQLVCMSAYRWLDRELSRLGFTVADEIESMENQQLMLEPGAAITVAIRDVVSADFPTLFALDQQAFDNPIWWQSVRHFERASVDALSFTVAEINGQVAGYQLSVQSASRSAHIVRLSVSPTFQSVGVGRSLMTHTIRTFMQHGLTKATLNTQIGNESSHRLYERFGFTSSDQRFKVWAKPL